MKLKEAGELSLPHISEKNVSLAPFGMARAWESRLGALAGASDIRSFGYHVPGSAGRHPKG